MKQIFFLTAYFGFVIGLFISCQHQAGAADDPMNILVLYADDWRHDTLGVAENAVVETPHLERLASEGMRFRQNCVTTSICGVSIPADLGVDSLHALRRPSHVT